MKLTDRLRRWEYLPAPSPAQLQARSRALAVLSRIMLHRIRRLPGDGLPEAVAEVAERRKVKGKPYWEWPLGDLCDFVDVLAMPARSGLAKRAGPC